MADLADILGIQLAKAQAAQEKSISPEAQVQIKPSENDMLAQAIIGLAPILAGAALGGARGGAVGGQAGMAGLQKLEEQKKEAKAEQIRQEAARAASLTQAIALAKEQRETATAQAQQARDIQRLKLESEKVGIEKTKAEKEKQPVSTQFQAGSYARRTEQAQDIFDQLEKAGFDRSKIGTGLETIFPQALKSQALQSQDQAERNFVYAILRRESGAAIAKSEFDSAEKQYFPRAGDSPEVLAAKKANRLQAIAGLKAEAGPALQQIPLITAQMPQKQSTKIPFMETEAVAAPAKPDFNSMSQEQLKTYLGIK